MLLTNLEKWGQFSNPGNRSCLRAEEREGEGEEKGDKGMEGRKYTKTSARFPQHARAEPAGCKDQQKWVLFPVLCSKHSQWPLLSRPPLFPFPWTYFTPFTAWIREGCSNTTCFLRPPLGSSIRPLPPRLFFPPSSPHSASSLFIYSWIPVLLLIILQRI